jgi:hypothetical protein
VTDLRQSVEKLERETDKLLGIGERLAWERIEKAAGKLVSKTGETDEARVCRYLNTPAGREAWRRYNEAKDDHQTVIAKADQAVAGRQLRDWAAAEFFSVVEKAQAAGYDEDRAVAFARERRPELVHLVDAARPEPMSKSAPSRGRVRKEALERFRAELVGDDRPARGSVKKAAALDPAAFGGGYLDLDLDLGDDWDEW